jgi:hypothetical protein
LGWRRLGLSNTLSVLLYSVVCVGVVPLGLGGGGWSQATRRTCFTVNFPSGDGSARKAAVARKQPLSNGNYSCVAHLRRSTIDDRQRCATHDVLRTSGDRRCVMRTWRCVMRTWRCVMRTTKLSRLQNIQIAWMRESLSPRFSVR